MSLISRRPSMSTNKKHDGIGSHHKRLTKSIRHIDKEIKTYLRDNVTFESIFVEVQSGSSDLLNLEQRLADYLHLHTPSLSPFDFVKKIRNGLPYKIITDLCKELGIKQQELSKIIGVNERTLARRRDEKKLQQDEGDRLFRLIHIYLFARVVFNDKTSTIQWLKSPKSALGGEIPLELLDTEIGAREVENLLGRIEYGVYS